MKEPVLFGFPISLLFLYFLIYAFLGWVMETTYCSIGEKRFVARGFLYGPICPIYGVGVLMMICWFAPLTGNPLLFYVVSTVCMSAWEYLVGWFLEVTTHIKYWDYSRYRFNIKGRICLQNCLIWGALAYVIIFWVHPFIADLLVLVPVTVQQITAAALALVLAADAAATIRELMLVSRMMRKLAQTGDELKVQLALGRAELSDRLGEAREVLSDRLEDMSGRLDGAKEAFSDTLDGVSDRLDGVKESISGRLDGARESFSEKLTAVKESAPGEAVEKLRAKYDELLVKAEQQTRHLRYSYSHMTSKSLSEALSDVAEASRRRKEERDAKKAAGRKGKKR